MLHLLGGDKNSHNHPGLVREGLLQVPVDVDRPGPVDVLYHDHLVPNDGHD